MAMTGQFLVSLTRWMCCYYVNTDCESNNGMWERVRHASSCSTWKVESASSAVIDATATVSDRKRVGGIGFSNRNPMKMPFR